MDEEEEEVPLRNRQREARAARSEGDAPFLSAVLNHEPADIIEEDENEEEAEEEESNMKKFYSRISTK